MSVKKLVRSFSTDKASNLKRKDTSLSIMESIIMELEYHMKLTEDKKMEEERQERRKKTGVDYSWLSTSSIKRYEMPHLERMQIEELAQQVLPNECSKIISSFRNVIDGEDDYKKMPGLLKSCIKQVIEVRPKEETMGEWMHRSLVNLKKITPSSKITPITYEDKQNNHNTDLSTFMAKSIEDLPV